MPLLFLNKVVRLIEFTLEYEKDRNHWPLQNVAILNQSGFSFTLNKVLLLQRIKLMHTIVKCVYYLKKEYEYFIEEETRE